MRVHYAKLLIVAAIAYAAESKTTTSVAGNFIQQQLNSTARDIDDERGFFNTIPEKVSAIFTSQKLKDAAKELEDFDDDFDLNSPLFKRWLEDMRNYASGKPPFSRAVIRMLTARFGDYRIAKFNQAKGNLFNGPLLKEAHMKYWLDRKMPARDVFKLLNFHEADYSFLTDPVFMYYSTYVERLNAKHPQMKQASISAIPECFSTPGDLEKRVNQALEMALDPSTTQIQRDTVKLNLVQYWLDRETSLEDILKCLKDYNAKSSSAVEKLSPVASLAACIGEDGMFTLVEAELKVHKSSTLVEQVQAERFKYWIDSGKSLWDVFELLKLDRAGGKLLENPLMNTFTKFSKGYYGNDPLIDFKAPEYAPGMPLSVTTDSEKALFQLWFVNNKTPEDVFKLLFLEYEVDEFCATSVYNTFLKYLDRYNLSAGKEKVTSLTIAWKYNTLVNVIDMKNYGAERLRNELMEDTKKKFQTRWTSETRL